MKRAPTRKGPEAKLLESPQWRGATVTEVAAHTFEAFCDGTDMQRHSLDCRKYHDSKACIDCRWFNPAVTCPAIEVRHPSGAVAYLKREKKL